MVIDNILKKALTLAEVTVVMVVLPLLMLSLMMLFHPKEVKQDAMLKAGKIVYGQITTATTDISRRYSRIGNLTGLYTSDKSERFELTDSDALDNLLDLYKTVLRFSRSSANTSYSGYSGNYKLRNGTFFSLQLYGNCTTTTTTYNPAYDGSGMYEYNTCGSIFFDINDDDLPNTLGVDRYIIAFDKNGLR